MKTLRHLPGRGAQQGMATLFVSLMLLFLITLVTLYAANTLVVEQQISGNQYRADQALASADAGLEWGIAYYDQGLDQNVDGTVDCTVATPCTNIFNAADAPRVEVVFCTPATTMDYDSVGDACDPPGPNALAIGTVSTGYSDDNASVRIVKQVIRIDDAFGEGPKSPVTALSTVATTGNLSVWNRYFNATVWSGEAVADWGSASTFIRSPGYTVEDLKAAGRAAGDEDQFLLSTTDDQYTAVGSDKKRVQMDYIAGDPNLKAIDPDGLFRNYFKGDKGDIRTMAERAGVYFDSEAKFEAAIDGGFDGGMAWVKPTDGTLDIKDELRFSRPIFLIVEGDIVGFPNGDVWGMIYVIGEVSSQGSPDIFGAVVAEGGVDFKGTVDIVYDPSAFDATSLPMGQARVLGTWKDW